METLSIGRDASNQIVLSDNFVSRSHARLIISDNGQVMIKDLGSSNGTFVNDARISECYLKQGDVVKCASVILNWQQYSPAPSVNRSPDAGGGRPKTINEVLGSQNDLR